MREAIDRDAEFLPPFITLVQLLESTLKRHPQNRPVRIAQLAQ
jgi:hypothetical protein